MSAASTLAMLEAKLPYPDYVPMVWCMADVGAGPTPVAGGRVRAPVSGASLANLQRGGSLRPFRVNVVKTYIRQISNRITQFPNSGKDWVNTWPSSTCSIAMPSRRPIPPRASSHPRACSCPCQPSKDWSGVTDLRHLEWLPGWPGGSVVGWHRCTRLSQQPQHQAHGLRRILDPPCAQRALGDAYRFFQGTDGSPSRNHHPAYTRNTSIWITEIGVLDNAISWVQTRDGFEQPMLTWCQNNMLPVNHANGSTPWRGIRHTAQATIHQRVRPHPGPGTPTAVGASAWKAAASVGAPVLARTAREGGLYASVRIGSVAALIFVAILVTAGLAQAQPATQGGVPTGCRPFESVREIIPSPLFPHDNTLFAIVGRGDWPRAAQRGRWRHLDAHSPGRLDCPGFELFPGVRHRSTLYVSLTRGALVARVTCWRAPPMPAHWTTIALPNTAAFGLPSAFGRLDAHPVFGQGGGVPGFDSEKGLFYSDDGGQTWTRRLAGGV